MPGTGSTTMGKRQQTSASVSGRPRHRALTRSLEDLQQSLLRAGARKVGIWDLTMNSVTGKDNKDPTSAATPAVLSRLGTSVPPNRRQRAQATGRCLKISACGTRMPATEVMAPPSPAYMTAPAAPRAPPKAQVIRKWVWGESLEVGEEEEEETKGGEGEVVAPMPKQAHEQGKMNTAKLDTGHVGRGDGGKKAFIDSPSSTFDSTCSTEAPTECALSQLDERPSPPAKDTDSDTTTTTSTTKAVRKEQHGRCKQQAMEGSALDGPFLIRLSDMSLRFPAPPTRPPPPVPAATTSQTLAISRMGKNITSGLPSLQFMLPSRWQKNPFSGRRRRRSTQVWVARSKATNSISGSSSFQSTRIFRSKDTRGVAKSAKGAKEPFASAPLPPPAVQAPPVPTSLPLKRRTPPKLRRSSAVVKVKQERQARVSAEKKEGVVCLQSRGTGSERAAATATVGVPPAWVWAEVRPNPRQGFEARWRGGGVSDRRQDCARCDRPADAVRTKKECRHGCRHGSSSGASLRRSAVAPSTSSFLVN